MSKEDLVKLYNTLSMIETKGENTKIMAQCLRFVEQKVKECEQECERKFEQFVQAESVPV